MIRRVRPSRKVSGTCTAGGLPCRYLHRRLSGVPLGAASQLVAVGGSGEEFTHPRQCGLPVDGSSQRHAAPAHPAHKVHRASVSTPITRCHFTALRLRTYALGRALTITPWNPPAPCLATSQKLVTMPTCRLSTRSACKPGLARLGLARPAGTRNAVLTRVQLAAVRLSGLVEPSNARDASGVEVDLRRAEVTCAADGADRSARHRTKLQRASHCVRQQSRAGCAGSAAFLCELL